MRNLVAAMFLLALAGCGRGGGGPPRSDAAFRADFRARGEATCREAAPAELAAIGRGSEAATSGIAMICGCTLEVAMSEKSSDQLRAQSARDLTPAERADQREIFTVCVDEYLRGTGAAAGGGPPGFTGRPPAGADGSGAPPPTERAHARMALTSLVSPDDYPAAALRSDEQGQVAFTLEVGPDGRVRSCAIDRSSGSSALDAATCRIMRSRARYDPARDARGVAVADRDRGVVVWRIPED
jgi:TonB family protein